MPSRDEMIAALRSRDQQTQTPQTLSRDQMLAQLRQRDAGGAASEPDKIHTATSAVRKGLAGALAGFSDEAAGVGEAAARALGVEGFASRDFTDMSLTTPTLDSETLKKAYVSGRDNERKMLRQDSVDNPTESALAELAGGLVSPVNKLTKGMSLAKAGAVYGGLSGFGSSEAEDAQGMAKDTAIGLGLGAGGGKLLGKAGEGIQKLVGTDAAQKVGEFAMKPARYAGEKLKDGAEALAFKAGGAMLRDFRSANDRGLVNKVGRWLLDTGSVKAGDSVEKIAGKATAQAQKAGQALESVYSQAQEKFGSILNKVGFDPARDKGEIIRAAREELGDAVGGESAIMNLSNYLDEVIARHGDKPNEQLRAKFSEEVQSYLPKFKNYLKERAQYRAALGTAGEDAAQPVLAGFGDDGQRAVNSTRQIELNGKAAAEASVPKPEPLMTQDFLPDLPTSETAVSRTMGREGEATFNGINQDAIDRTPGKLADRLALDDQQQFLDQNANEQISLFGRQSEMQGLDAVPKRMVEAPTTKIVQTGEQASMPIFTEAPVRPVKPGQVANPMEPRRANNIKSAIDSEINYARDPLKKDPIRERAFSAARKVVADKVDQAIESLGGDKLLEQLKSANRNYSYAKRASDMAGDRVNREAAHKMFGLTDTIAAGAGIGYGAATDDYKGAIGIIAAKKLVEKYGASTLAVGFDKASKFLLRSPQFSQLATANPRAFQATVISLVDRLAESGAFQKAASNQPSELDTDSSVPANYQERPTPSPNREPQSTPPPKGQDKWASDGFENVAKHDPNISASRAELMANPKTRNLLIAASDLKPGSRAMKDVMLKIQNRMKAN